MPDINSETNSPFPIINVACKYLRQFLGTSSGVATLPIGLSNLHKILWHLYMKVLLSDY